MIDLLTRNIPDPETQTVIDSLTEKLNSKPFLVGNWSFLSFELKLKEQFNGDNIRVGTILPCSEETPPDSSYKFCDGNAGVLLSGDEYPEYNAIVGKKYGGTSTAANVPDFRGLTFRVVDGSAGRDPDKLARTPMAAGGNSGNKIGSVQSDGLMSHTHSLTLNTALGSDNAGYAQFASDASISGTSTATTAATGGSETRMKNANVGCVIKVKSSGEIISIRHSLNFVPTDFIVSSVVTEDGSDAGLKILHKQTDNKNLTISANKSCKVRMFIGSYEEKR